MRTILFISKPLVPPWNDSGKNLPRDLAQNLTRYRATVFTTQGAVVAPKGSSAVALYRSLPESAFAPLLLDRARVFAHLLSARGALAWHFFFAPNPLSCRAAGAVTQLRRVRSLHTLSSVPDDARSIAPILFADLNVVLSQRAELQLRRRGVASQRLMRIAPGVLPLTPLSLSQRVEARAQLALPRDAPLVVFPGDLEFGDGASRLLAALSTQALHDVQLVFACRMKTARAWDAAQRLRAEAGRRSIAARVHFLGEIPHIHALLGCADVVALPSSSLYAKMDYPLVLLEAMSLARPVIVASNVAAAELCEGGAALSVEPRVDAVASALASLLSDAPRRAELGARARERVLAHFSIEKMVERYEHAYDTLLA